MVAFCIITAPKKELSSIPSSVLPPPFLPPVHSNSNYICHHNTKCGKKNFSTINNWIQSQQFQQSCCRYCHNYQHRIKYPIYLTSSTVTVSNAIATSTITSKHTFTIPIPLPRLHKNDKIPE